MKLNRRQIIVSAVTSGLGLVTMSVRQGFGENRHALYGKWHVRCPDGSIDIVTEGTRQHRSNKTGVQCFVNGGVTVICPNEHANTIDLRSVDVLKSHKCTVCKAECQGWG